MRGGDLYGEGGGGEGEGEACGEGGEVTYMVRGDGEGERPTW